MVNGKEVPVIFNGTSSRMGTFETDDQDLQGVMENSKSFNISFGLNWEVEEKEPELFVDPNAGQTDPPAEDQSEGDQPVENTPPPSDPNGFTEVPGVNNFNSAKRWLITNKNATPDKVKNKDLMVAFCEKHKVKFTEMK